MKGDKRANKNAVISESLTANTLEENAEVVEKDTKADDSVSTKKNQKNKNKNKAENGFVRFFKKIGRGFKEMGSELKKVSWPTFFKTLKSTGVVLVFVLVFLAVLMGMDALFGFGFNALLQIK